MVVLDLHRSLADDGSEQLEFVVTDTGIGMDQATMDRLFKRFSQGDESRSRRHGGTGLGLEISRSLARLMGGDVTAKSVTGEGSSFCFRMPLHAIASPAPPALAAPPGGARATSGTPVSCRCTSWWPRTTRSTTSTWRHCSKGWATSRTSPATAWRRCRPSASSASTSC